MSQFPQYLTIYAIKEETSLCKSFYLNPEIGNINFHAGQFITFNEDPKNASLSRSYSISTAPYEETIAITVKRQENGYFSRLLIDKMKVGDRIRAVGVFGKFILPEEISSFKSFLFFAAGSGIVPIFSLIKDILYRNEQHQVYLYYSNRSKFDTIFYDELNLMHLQFGNRLRIEYFFSAENNIHNARISAFMIPDILTQVDMDSSLCYLCGPIDYMDTISMALLTYGFRKDAIIKEEFYIYNEEIENEIDPPDDTNAYDVTIELGDRQKTISVQYPESILHAALRNGIHIPYSCSSGQCGSCVAMIKKGKVWMTYNSVLTDQEIANGLTLTCMGYPIEGDVTIGFQENYKS